MKKYRPYNKFPDDIVGKAVRSSISGLSVVLSLNSSSRTIATSSCPYTVKQAFEQLVFLDGTPVGEEYEDRVELEHDKVYLVRSYSCAYWLARHFHKMSDGHAMFYRNGRSYKTVELSNDSASWTQVCEYSGSLVGKAASPAEYLIKQD